MSTSNENNEPSGQDLETWIFGQLESESIELEPILGALDRLAEQGQGEQAASCAELVEEALAQKEQFADAIAVMERRATLDKSFGDSKKDCAKTARRILGASHKYKAFVDEVGFDSKVSARECIARLRRMVTLDCGTLCHEKTWGFGVVKDVDTFYKRVEVDFARKKGHQLSFAYAAQALDLIDDDHLLARKHRDPEVVEELIKKHPAQVVRMALSSYGEMNAPRLQEILVPEVVSEAGWKRFWDNARKELKKDPLVHMPTKRTEAICLLDEEKSFDDRWFDQLLSERSPERILELISHYLQEEGPGKASEHGREVMGNRLAFVLKAAGTRHPELVASVFLLARHVKPDASFVNVDELTEMFLKKRFLNKTLSSLTARQIGDFIGQLMENNKESTLAALLELLPDLSATSMSDVMSILTQHGFEEQCAEHTRGKLDRQEAGLSLLSWLARNPEKVKEWNLGSVSRLLGLMVGALEVDESGARLRAQKQISDRFVNPDWLKTWLDMMDEKERRIFMERVRDATAWESLDHRSVMGQIVKLDASLQAVVTAGKRGQRKQPRKRVPVTSMRSYREREEQLKNILTKELPQIAKEIGKAREHGDLRENAEYKAAKEQQRLLHQRQDDLERMLAEVKPTDFREFPTDVAGVATGVRLRYDDGSEEQFYILGEWDSDSDLGILSSNTRMAQALEGAKQGDRVEVPTADGQCTCMIQEISALPDDIRAWINAVPSAVTQN